MLDTLFGDEIMMPELKDSHFVDEEQRLYRAFIEQATTAGITMPLIYNDSFRQIKHLKENPKMIEAVKKAFEAAAKTQKKKQQFENVRVSGEEFIENLPLQIFMPNASLMNVITKEAQQAYSIRQLIYDLFPLYSDDTVQLTISLHGKVLFQGQNTIKKMKIPTTVISNITVPKGQILMFSVNIRLIDGGDNRRRHEDRSNIFNVDAEKDRLLSKEHVMEVFSLLDGRQNDPEKPTFKLNESQFIERAKLFSVDLTQQNQEAFKKLESEMVMTDFGAKELTDLRDVFKRFYQYEANSELLKFKGKLNVELTKMKEWLNREQADGFNGLF